MTSLDLATLRAALEQATPGPWEAARVLGYVRIYDASGREIAELLGPESTAVDLSNATLLVALRNAAPALLEIATVAAELDALYQMDAWEIGEVERDAAAWKRLRTLLAALEAK